MIHQAIERYHALLNDHPMDAEAFSGFLDRLRRAKITYGDRVSVEYLRAQFLSPEQEQLIRGACRTLWQALDRLAEAFPGTPRLLEDLALTEGEQQLIAIDPGYPGLSTMARFDSFFQVGEAGEELHFVELNAECPAGPAYTEVMAETFRDGLPAMQAFAREYELRGFATRDRLVRVLLDTWASWCHGSPARLNAGGEDPHRIPNVAIVDWKEVSTYAEFELCKAYFESRGIPTVIADPRELVYRDGRLCSGDFAIDLVYRRVLTNEFLSRFDQVQPMFEAYRDGAVCVVNNFRSKLLHKKMIFGLLTDGQNQHFFNEEQRAAIARHIPWTRRVRPGRTDKDGTEIDLVPYIRANRDRLVLKPNDEYGGSGIYIGWTVEDDAAWEAAIEQALAGVYVVQEKVPVSTAPFPTYRDGMTFDRMTVDLDPFVWQGDVEGYLTRLSGGALCNVTAGGGIVPTFVIVPRA